MVGDRNGTRGDGRPISATRGGQEMAKPRIDDTACTLVSWSPRPDKGSETSRKSRPQRGGPGGRSPRWREHPAGGPRREVPWREIPLWRREAGVVLGGAGIRGALVGAESLTLGAGGGGELLLELGHPAAQVLIGGGEDADREQPGVPRATDRDGRD